MAEPRGKHRLLEYNATIVDRLDMTDKLSVFRVEPNAGDGDGRDGPQIPEFIGGQYAILGLNNEKDPEKGLVKRAYSIASAPEDRKGMDFYIRYVDLPTSDNPLTHLLWNSKTGDGIWLDSKLRGKFTLHHTIEPEDERLKIFVAAGTGLAPFYSIVKSFANRNPNVEPSQFVILHGASHPSDLGYGEELTQLLNQNDAPRYFPTCSRPHLHPDWDGHCGRVETFFNNEDLAALEKDMGFEPGRITPDAAVVYICGLQGTIAETLIRMLARGFIPENRRLRKALELPVDEKPSLFFEQYDTTPIIDLKDEELLVKLRQSFPHAMYNK